MNDQNVELCGMLVSQAVYDEAFKEWPVRPPTGWDDRGWQACLPTTSSLSREVSARSR